ncbi:MAG TPA: molybdenum cofactor biosynthesis protein B [Aeromonadales bacterium]|nr:molybdenum cofactor biosynthesis protein B [Aeromonadales bacterium]
MSHKQRKPFLPLNIAVLTISDTRTRENDTSGDYLQTAAESAGHKIISREIVIDDVYKMREVVSRWIADDRIQVIISTGGTGFTTRDSTPEALRVLFDSHIEGFGELFRAISYEEIGTSTVQSRAFGGIANRTLVFALPGSTNACRTGWDKILLEQLDASHRPCNFVPHINIIEE